MKIGIITFHHIDNYGATLQTYGLWSFLQNQGYNVEIIDYRPYQAIKFYTKGLSPITKSFKFNKKAFSNIVRSWKMRQFLVSHMKLSQKKVYFKRNLHYFSKKYDIVICGSDQIWCLDSFRGFDSSFFLDFVSNQSTRKLSYAASFGNTTELNNFKDEICKLINQFQTILVRDSNSKKIIVNECNGNAKKVLDPTFLVNYDMIKHPPQFEEKYLLIYNRAQELNSEEEYFIKRLAKAHNLIIVSVGKYNRIADINLASASPQEWVGAYSLASYVITNTYHGTIFSILFQKPFHVLLPENKSQKITDLLSDLGLENRILTNQLEHTSTLIDDSAFNVNYDLVSKILDKKINDSKKYLIEAISGQMVKNF